MQPAKNPAQSHSVQNSRLPGFVIALLIFGALKGWPLLFAQAEQLVIPTSPVPQSTAGEALPALAQEEKSLTFDEKHKDWAVMMLLYETAVTVRDDWSFEAHIHRKVLIQTKDGAGFGEIPIIYDSDTDKVRILKAVTVTPDGREHPPTRVQDLTVHEGYAMYSGAKRKILSMPEVALGSVIDLEYIKITKGLPMPRVFWDIEHMEQPFPIKEQRIVYHIPKRLEVRFKSFLKNWDPTIKEENGMMVYSWERKDYGPDTSPREELLPPPTVKSINDGIEFSSIKSWQDVVAWYYGLIQKNMKVTPEIRKAAKQAIAGRKGLRDKVRGVLEYMQENIRYVSMAFGNYAIEPHPTNEVFRNKYGDCKDQSLLAKAMLEAIGIKADLALFAREFDGNDPKEDLPLPGLYDHVLLKVYDSKEGDFYVDPLLEGYDIGEYPLQYQGGYALVISSGGARFEKLPALDREQATESIKETVEIRPDGSAIDKGECMWDLQESIDFRKKVKAMNREERKKFFENFKNEMVVGGKLLEMSWERLDAKYGRLESVITTDCPDEYPVNDGVMVIDLPAEPRLEGWTAKERKNPIFFPVNSIKSITATYQIPTNFEVFHLPKGIDIANGFFSMRRTIKKTGNTITVSELKQTRRIELPASEYSRIKAFYDKLPALTEQRIILKKR